MTTSPAGVQVILGPANQLSLGTVETGPAAVTLETIDGTHQRLNFSIPSPTGELVAAQTASAAAATAAATAAAGSQTAATAAQTAATASQTAAQAAAAQAAAAAVTAANAAPTDAQMTAIVQAKLLPSNLALDTDGVPFISPGSNTVFVFQDTDGRPYFVS